MIPAMRIVSYNIQYGRGRDGRFDLDRIAREIAGADLIALQEVERFWTRSGGVDQPRLLARRLTFSHLEFKFLKNSKCTILSEVQKIQIYHSFQN